MTHVYFHCSNRNEVLIDRCGAAVDDFAEARDHAACVVRSPTTARSLMAVEEPEPACGRCLIIASALLAG